MRVTDDSCHFHRMDFHQFPHEVDKDGVLGSAEELDTSIWQEVGDGELPCFDDVHNPGLDCNVPRVDYFSRHFVSLEFIKGLGV